MNESRAAVSLRAPGAASGEAPWRLPGRGARPAVDEHLVQPEITRDEVVGGVRVVASPAQPPHATQHVQLDYVLRAHASPGYRAASDLLTRHDEESDFATDTCLFRDGVDPATGDRFLEEIAFEVVSEQSQRLVEEKARRMYRRGVRRIFAVWVKGERVCEWSPEANGWRELERGARIEDRCLVVPLAVAALLDAAAADNAVVEALAAKGNAALGQREEAAEARGKAAALAEGILKLLESRALAVSAAQRQEILACRDLGRLERWLLRAAVVAAADDVVAEP